MKKKNQLFYLSSILLIGLGAKCLSMISKILLARNFSLEAISLFSLINPLLILIITLSNLSLPTTIATIISKNPSSSKKVMISSFIICLSLSLLLMLILAFSVENLSVKIFKNKDVTYSLYTCVLLVPLTSFSSIVKGYCLGKNQVTLASFSTFFEESGRLLFVIIACTLFSNSSSAIKSSLCVLSLCLGEIFQISCLIIFSNNDIPNRIPLFFKEVTNKKNYDFHQVLSLSLPLTTGRLIGSITYFFEPIIVIFTLSKMNYSIANITLDYGIISGYVMPLLLLPGFFSLTLSNYLLPRMGKLVRNNKIIESKNLFLRITLYSTLIGLIISIFFFAFPSNLLTLFYGSSLGKQYVKILSFPFIIYYMESPILAAMNILNLGKEALLSTLLSSSARIICLFIFLPKFYILGVSISALISVYLNVFLNFIAVIRKFNRFNIHCVNKI